MTKKLSRALYARFLVGLHRRLQKMADPVAVWRLKVNACGNSCSRVPGPELRQEEEPGGFPGYVGDLVAQHVTERLSVVPLSSNVWMPLAEKGSGTTGLRAEASCSLSASLGSD